MFQNCGASFCVFQRRFKMEVRANFCVLQRCTFTTRGLTSFLNVLAFSNRITTNVVAKLWCKFLCFSTAFQKDSACKFLCPATLHFSYKRVHKFFERACFKQPYYDKRCFKLVVQVAVFLQLRFKRKVRANFFALQLCTFPARRLTSFLNVFTSCNRITTNVFQNCGASCGVFQRLFKRAVQANFCALQRCTFPTRGLASFLNVLAFSNRITTNVVAKFVTCCQK